MKNKMLLFYFMTVFLVLNTVYMVGVLAPAMISEPNDVSVMMGVGVLVLYAPAAAWLSWACFKRAKEIKNLLCR